MSQTVKPGDTALRQFEQTMKKVLLALLLMPPMAEAVICKIVDPEGGVSYTDVPVSECPHVVDLPGYSSYAPGQPQRRTGPQGAFKPAAGEAVFDGYTAARIVRPEANGTVRSDEGKVSVQIELTPTLQEGHYLRLMLDADPAGIQLETTSIELTNVERGRHELTAAVFDKDGTQLTTTAPVVFFLRQLTRQERDLVDLQAKEKLSKEQQDRLERIEAERKEQEAKQLEEQRAQEAKVKDLSTQSDFAPKRSDSGAFRDRQGYAGQPPDPERFKRDAGSKFEPRSTKEQQESLRPGTIKHETETAKNPPPGSAPIPSIPKNPAYAPSFTPPKPN